MRETRGDELNEEEVTGQLNEEGGQLTVKMFRKAIWKPSTV